MIQAPFQISDLLAIQPDLAVLIGALAVLALDIPLRAQKSKSAVFYLSVASLVAGLVFLGLGWNKAPDTAFSGMIQSDLISRSAKLVLLLCGLFTLLLSRRHASAYGLVLAEYPSLLLFAVGGMMLFAGCVNLMAAFVALETFSLAFYVLAGFDRKNAANREAALKYFLIGALAAAFYLFGLAMVYGATGTVSIDGIRAAFAIKDNPAVSILYGGLALLLVALGFKVGLAPFHLWAPDAYEGAPTPITAFLSAGAKAAGFAVLARVLGASPLEGPVMASLVSCLAILTLVMANVGALKQESLKRLMAYSSVAHSGYALVALAGGSADGASALMTYVMTYTIMNFAVFALLIAAENESAAGREGRQLTLNDIQGLGFQKPLFSFLLAVLMFAMAGIPPTAGFVAKLVVFKAALSAGQTTLVVFAVLNSVLSAAFYLKVLVALYMKPALPGQAQPVLNGWLGALALSGAVLSLAWGVLPASLLALFR